MSPSYFWLNIVLLAVGTLAIRSSIILASTRVKISPRVKEIFSFIPSAILPALAVPMVFYHEGAVDWLLGKERLAILPLATVVAFLTKKMAITLVFGLALLYIFTQLSL
jgi:branched-subunit amino acid transport protein